MPEPVIRPRKPGGSVPNVTRSMYSYASHHSVPNPMTRTWDSGASRVPANAAVGGSPSRNPGRTTAHFDATRSRERASKRKPPLNSFILNSSRPKTTSTRSVTQQMSRTVANAPFAMRTTSVDDMMGRQKVVNGRVQNIPSYDALSDPALANYWARKFGWTIAAGTGNGAPQAGYDTTTDGGYSVGPGEDEYAITITTEDEFGAGSTCPKYITLNGRTASSERLPLLGPETACRRGNTHTFYVVTHRVGVLSSIVLENEGLDRRDGWLCKAIMIQPMRVRKTYTFTCGKWLSRYEGDRLLELALYPNTGPGLVEYEVEVATGDSKDAGTTDEVYITLHGTKDSSERKLLGRQFPRGKKNVFVVRCAPLGRMQRLEVERGAKTADGWWLDKVVVTSLPNAKEKATFSWGKWLSTERGDGLMFCELVPDEGVGDDGGGQSSDYELKIYTGDAKNATTHATVSVMLVGAIGKFGMVEVVDEKGKHPKFEKNKCVTFTVAASGLGALEGLHIGHNSESKAAGWFLDKVDIVNKRTGNGYAFPCGRWLSTHEDDGHTYRDLACSGAPTAAFVGTIYHLRIHTGMDATGANVHCILKGSRGSTAKIHLDRRNHKDGSEKHFKKHRIDQFNIDCGVVEIGELESIVLGHDNTGLGPDWNIDAIEAECPKLGKSYHVKEPKDKDGFWLASGKADGRTEREFQIDPAKTTKLDVKGTWLIHVETGSQRWSGTDARVYLTLYGDQGKTEEMEIGNKTDNWEDGQTDEFKIEFDVLGKLSKIRIRHDNSGPTPGWLLKTVTCTHIDTGAAYNFVTEGDGVWLSRRDGDGEIVRELPASGPLIETPLESVPYTVNIKTGTPRGAGTDANVFVTVFGEKGDSGPRELRKSATHRNKWERGNTDTFDLLAVDLGKLTHVHVRHDNSGLGGSWFLEDVRILPGGNGAHDGEDGGSKDPNAVDGEAVFPCHRWLAKNEDDGAIERTLPLLGAVGIVEATTTYIIEVKTGTVPKAGTDANVHLTLFGAAQDSGSHKLQKSETFRDKFEAGHTDRFRFESVDLGTLRKLVIGHDGAGFGAGWFLETVTVEVPSDGRRYIFPCSRWFAKGEDDGLVERELHFDAKKDVVRIEETDSYECRVHTSTVSGAGTDSRVFAVFYGTEGKTDEMPLANKTDNFEKGMTDTFKLELGKIGELTKMRIWHDNAGLGSAWHLGYVEMESLQSHKVSTFRADRWLSKKEGLLAEIPVSEVTEIDAEGNRVEAQVEEQNLITYEVQVHTANVEKAGTDARVSLTMYGEVDGVKVDTGERKLAKSSTYSDKFERGHIDVFKIQSVSLGELKKLKIWHDNKGLKLGGNQWLCEKIVVVDPSDEGKSVEFPCGMWLSKAEGLIRELMPKREGPLEEASAETVRYIINVHTSDVRWAGTDANIAVVLYGETDDSGAIPLTHSETYSNKFERAHVDKFIYEAADLGDLKKLRIGHDNAGGGADWHLDKVEVDAPAVGKQWVFPCNRWFAKGKDDSALERVLVPKSEDPDDDSGGLTVYRAKQPYEVQVYTSNVSSAGTENPVTMCLYGKDELGADLHDEFQFPKHNFRKGAGTAEGAVPDKFNFDIADVGVPYKLRVSVKPTGTLFSTCSWHLDKVVLFDQKRQERLEFRCEKWISTDKGKDGGQTSRELVLHERLGISKSDPTKLEEKRKSRPTATQKNYLVSVTTGSEKGSGTDANVFIDIVGKEGSTGDRPLKSSKTHFDKFEKGHTDEFILQDIVDLGELKEVTIRHDNKGSLKSGAAWFCENITVSVVGEEDSKTWDFPCNQWLSTKKGDGKIHKTVPVYKDPAVLSSLATTARKRAEDASHTLKGLGGGASKEQRAKIQVDVARLLKDAEEAEHDLAIATGGAAKRGDLTDYELLVVTGSKSSSGTVARVFVEIMGVKTGSKTVAADSKDGVAATTGDALANYKVVVKTKPGGGEVHGDAVLLVQGTSNECTIPIQPDGVGGGSGPAISPGAVHEAMHELAALGTIKNVSVQLHPRDGNDPSAAVWALEGVEIYDVQAGSEWMFACPGAGVLPGAEPKPLLHTGDKAGQSTSTGPLELRDNKITFKTGSSDRFTLPAPDVGEITAIKVWHTGKSKSDNWYCEQITLTIRETAKVVIFPCKAWLSGVKGGKPERLLKPAATDQFDSVSTAGSRAPSPGGKSLGARSMTGSLMSLASKSGSTSSMASLASAGGPYSYTVKVTTGEQKDAGTDARVSCRLFGQLGDSGDHKLAKSDTHRDKFERGNVDVFHFGSEYLGQLTKLKIWHDNHKGAKFFTGNAAWFLEKVEVIEDETNNSYEFPCSKWLSRSHEDKQISRELVCADQTLVDRSAEYRVTVKTYDGGPGTPHSVRLVLEGQDGRRGALDLNNTGSCFAPGGSDDWVEPLIVLGDLKSAEVSLVPLVDSANSAIDLSADAGWGLESIEVVEIRSGSSWLFPSNSRQPLTLDASARKLVVGTKEEGAVAKIRQLQVVKYHITTKTSNVNKAGTDANVTVTVVGANSSSGPRKLDNNCKTSKYRDKFEKDHEDSFVFETLDLGALKSVTIEHDGKGFKNSNWHVEWVKVEIKEDPTMAVKFPCGQWLSKADGLSKVLLPE